MCKVRNLGINNWFAADTYLGKSIAKKLAHNTWLVRRDDCIEVTYHGHTIARYWNHREYMSVSSCGYRTSTTKERISQLMPNQYSLYQKNFEWFVWNRDKDTTVPFEDNMTIFYE
jgi:hypothetical protein